MRWLIRLLVSLDANQLLLLLGFTTIILYLLVFKVLGALFGKALERVWAKKDLVEIVILGSDYNYHDPMRVDSLHFNYPLGGVDYHVTERALYKKEKTPIEQITDRFKRIRDRYLILFRGDDPYPIEWEDGEVHPTTLAKVRTSQALKKALKEMFRADLLQGRGIVVIFVIVTILTLVIARKMGVI